MPTTREIDRVAQNIFNGSLPPSWLSRKQDPDIHIDYYIELSEKDKPSGVIFGVQLKGTNSPRYKNHQIKISMKSEHISYYLDKVKQPVFIVVVDIRNKDGFWLFIQEWAKEELTRRDWRKNKKIDVKIPITHSLLDIKSFHEEIIRADTYIRNLWPSSIQAALHYEKQSLEALDDRLVVDISCEEGGTNYNIKAKEPFDFTIQFRGSPHIRDKFTDLFNSGKTADFKIEEILNVEGSRLLEKMFERKEWGKLSIDLAHKPRAHLFISTIDESRYEKLALYGIEGEIISGNKEVQFSGSLKDSPLVVAFFFSWPMPSHEDKLTINLNFDVSPWNNVQLLALPHFEKLKDFFTSIHEGCSLKVVCEINGNHAFTATSPKIDNKFMEPTIRHLKLLDKMRVIAREVHINPKYLNELSINADEFSTICLLYELITSGVYRQDASGIKFSCKLVPNQNFIKMWQNPKGKDFSENVSFEPHDQKFSFLGEAFTFQPLRYLLTKAILSTDLSEILLNNELVNKKGIDLQWIGAPDSELIIKKIKN